MASGRKQGRGQILIAGVGNVLRQDDGFGIEVVRQLRQRARVPAGVEIIEVGIGGISLVQQLYDQFDVLIVVDALQRHGAPGELYFMETQVADLELIEHAEKKDFLADLHYANPERALILAKALGILPKKVFVFGCQPERHEDFRLGLSDAVKRAIPIAVAKLERLVEKYAAGIGAK